MYSIHFCLIVHIHANPFVNIYFPPSNKNGQIPQAAQSDAAVRALLHQAEPALRLLRTSGASPLPRLLQAVLRLGLAIRVLEQAHLIANVLRLVFGAGERNPVFFRSDCLY